MYSSTKPWDPRWINTGLTDLSFLARMVGLHELYLGVLNKISEFPSLANLKNLNVVGIDQMKLLANFEPICDAPALIEINLIEMTHLTPSDVAIFEKHPTIKRAGVNSGVWYDPVLKDVRRYTSLPGVVPLERCYGKTDIQILNASLAKYEAERNN